MLEREKGGEGNTSGAKANSAPRLNRHESEREVAMRRAATDATAVGSVVAAREGEQRRRRDPRVARVMGVGR